MRKFNNKSGFTLIEIIVVLIIVGILAAIALPNLFSNIQKSRAAEGLGVLDGYKDTMEGCVQGHEATAASNCLMSALTLATATGNFLYSTPAAPANGSLGYSLKAVYSAGTADTITLAKDTSTGLFTCTGVNNFSSAC